MCSLPVGDCTGNNIAIFRNASSPSECAALCNATDKCAGFSLNPTGDSESHTLCVPKSQACESPVHAGHWTFYFKVCGPNTLNFTATCQIGGFTNDVRCILISCRGTHFRCLECTLQLCHAAVIQIFSFRPGSW